MNTIQTHKVSVGEQFLLSYIESVIRYAENDPAFANHLASAASSLRTSSADTADIFFSVHTSPVDQLDAISTTRWIHNTLQSHPEYKVATSRLAHWAQNYESPKDVVLGIVGLAIIGPTLGIVSSKKKKKRKSQLVIEKSYCKALSKKDLVQLTTLLTQKVIAQEVALAGGNVYNLHPDSAAWCIEEAQNKIYTDSTEHLRSLVQTAQTERLSHTTEKDAHGNVVAVVISPSVNDSLVEDSSARSV